MTVDLDSLQDQLATLADFGVKKALAKGAHEAEALVSHADDISIAIRKAMIEARRGAPSGIGIRVVVDGKLGFAATSGTNETQIEKTAGEAVAVARITPLDPDFKHLPDPVTRSSRDGTIDDRVIGFSEKDALKQVNTLAETTLKYDKRIKSLEGDIGVGGAVFAIANSRGIASTSKASYIYGGIYCIAMKEKKQKTGSDWLVS